MTEHQAYVLWNMLVEDSVDENADVLTRFGAAALMGCGFARISWPARINVPTDPKRSTVQYGDKAQAAARWLREWADAIAPTAPAETAQADPFREELYDILQHLRIEIFNRQIPDRTMVKIDEFCEKHRLVKR